MIAWRISRKINAALHQRRRRGAFRKPFSGNSAKRLLLLTIGERIPQSQIFPFHYYARDFRDALDTEIREVEISDYVAGLPDGPRDATTVCFQTPFDIPDDELARTMAAIRDRNPKARLVYLDWFAPTDLRMAHRLPEIDHYVTKHVLRDRDRYAKPLYGDTTLMDYYGRKYDLPHDETRFPIPPGFRDKLHLGPSFVTADFMLPAFAAGQRPDGPRPIDLHARIAVDGSPWYEAMRAESLAAAESLPDTETVTGTGIGHHRFISELQQSKICFSPFGYGEVCWRDFEAVLTGAVLLKQDMQHVETKPNIFVPNETYVPLRWDLSDFEEKARWLINDPAARDRIARQAFDRLHDYARSGRFAAQMAPLVG
ncbi:glycosyltransferase family protein [Roseovarius sp.]|uniref:glycosyltransferase family protein n=1 Tax=Roseovarius sp. TaxID=1486281 RepID=UPI003BAA3020